MTACATCGATNPPGARFCNACGTRLERPEGREPSAERRVVTMLFCDVRGSTSMAEQMDAEEWTDVMNAAYEHLIAPVYRYEGTVARLMGDAILAFFGAPTAHEDDPQRAVMAGLEIVASTRPFRERLARERGLDLDVRVGINTGPVVVGEVGSELRQEYTAMGDAVNVAARMEQTAEPGTVQITEDTHRLVADLFEVEPLGAIEVKGKRRPVPAYRVLGRREGLWRVRAARRLGAPLVGRRAEVEVLRAALEDVERGRGSVVLLSGEPGIGKSRLVEEANAIWSERHLGDDRRWDLWHCVPYDEMQPYAQYRRLLRERAGIAETDPPDLVRDRIAELVRSAPSGWAERSERIARALLGVELPGEPRLEGEAFQREAVEVVVGSTLAQPGPRLVVFEDLHWCDHASLELVRETLRLVERAPIVCLVTLRPDRAAPSWELRAWAKAELGERVRAIELEPLTREQGDELIGALLPLDIPDDLRLRILDATEGNPLFVEEVARDLIDRGLIERGEDGSWRLAGEATEVTIPGTVQSLITVGLDRLREEARRTLQAAAVIGRTFDTELLGAVAGTDVLADLRELETCDLVCSVERSPRDEYTFRHALTQEAAYGSMLLKHRRAMHRRVVDALEAANAERLDEVAAVLVRHCSEAGDDERTLRFAEVAGDAAARLYANAEAEAHYGLALDVALHGGADRALLRSLFERRGSALELAGRHDEAIAVYEAMHDEAHAAGDEAMELAANSAIALLYSTATPAFDPERGRRLSERNVVAARRLGDRSAEARALWNIVVANIYGGGADEARAVEAGEASLAIARDLGDRAQLAFTLQDVCRAYVSLGDLGTAEQRLREARALWEDLDNRPMLSENFALASSLRLLRGDHPGALSDAETALSMSEAIDNRWGQAYALICRYRVELDLGEIGTAMGSMRRCLEIGEDSGFTFAGIVSRCDLAHVFVELGDPEQALPYAERALELAQRRLPPAIPFAQIARSAALWGAGAREAARSVLDEIDVELLPGADRAFSHVGVHLARSRTALAMDRVDEAREAATAALDYLRSNGIGLLVADSLATAATVAAAEGRLDDAERDLAEAVHLAEGLGERVVLWKALALASDVRARRGDETGATQLRRRALEIVGSIAAGVDDPELRERFLARPEVAALRPDR